MLTQDCLPSDYSLEMYSEQMWGEIHSNGLYVLCPFVKEENYEWTAV